MKTGEKMVKGSGVDDTNAGEQRGKRSELAGNETWRQNGEGPCEASGKTGECEDETSRCVG
jgi:hypothetical protein